MVVTRAKRPGAGPPPGPQCRTFGRGDNFGERMPPPNPTASPGPRQAAPAPLTPAHLQPGMASMTPGGLPVGEGPPGWGIPKTPPLGAPTASPPPLAFAVEEEEEEEAEFRATAPRAPLPCPPTSRRGQEVQAGAWQRGAGCPHLHHKIHVKDESAASCLLPTEEGRGQRYVWHPAQTPPQIPACTPPPSQQTGQTPSLPTRPPNPWTAPDGRGGGPGRTSERHRRVLCYSAFVVTRQRVPVPIVPSSCPPHTHTHTPRRWP